MILNDFSTMKSEFLCKYSGKLNLNNVYKVPSEKYLIKNLTKKL